MSIYAALIYNDFESINFAEIDPLEANSLSVIMIDKLGDILASWLGRVCRVQKIIQNPERSRILGNAVVTVIQSRILICARRAVTSRL